MSHDLTQKIVRNTLFNTAGRFWGFLIALFLTPYIISHIGVERYGIWSIVGVLTGYFGLLDFGVGASFVKYIAEFHARDDQLQINRIVNSGLTFYLGLALVLISISFLLIGPILTLLKIPPGLYAEARFVFLLGIVIFALSNALSIFGAVPNALQRMDLSNAVNIIISIPSAAGTIFFLEKGFGLPGLMVNNAIIFGLLSAANIAISHRLLPELKITWFSFNREIFSRLFHFGYKLQLTRISGMVSSQTDKILITYFLSVGLVTFYQLGNSIVYYAMSLVGLLSSALVPAFTEIEARGERKRLTEAYLRSTRYVTFLVVPVFLFLIAAASSIMFVWMGAGYVRAGLIIRILSVGWLFNMIAQVGAFACMAVDRPEIMAAGSIITVAANLVLSIVLIKFFGFAGVAWGTTVAVLLGTFYFQNRLHKVFGLPVTRLTGIIAPYLAIGCVALAVAVGLDFAVTRYLAPDLNRVQAFCFLVIKGIVFSAVYLWGVKQGRLFEPADIGLFREKIPLLRFFFGAGRKDGRTEM